MANQVQHIFKYFDKKVYALSCRAIYIMYYKTRHSSEQKQMRKSEKTETVHQDKMVTYSY